MTVSPANVPAGGLVTEPKQSAQEVRSRPQQAGPSATRTEHDQLAEIKPINTRGIVAPDESDRISTPFADHTNRQETPEEELPLTVEERRAVRTE